MWLELREGLDGCYLLGEVVGQSLSKLEHLARVLPVTGWAFASDFASITATAASTSNSSCLVD
jgi:hypothetical protein